MHTGVVRPRGVNMGNRRLIGAEMKGCQVRDWIVGERDMSFSRILYIIILASYGLKILIQCIDKPSGKSKKRFNGHIYRLSWPLRQVAWPLYFAATAVSYGTTWRPE